jgi:hypothetical protein
VIRTIRLTLADVDEADALLTIDDERRRAGDVEGCEPEPMVDAVALDDRTVWVDEDREGESMGAAVSGHLLGALADDHHHPGPQGVIALDVGLQLLQLLAAVRSPGTADEHDERYPGAENIRETNFLAIPGPQRERGSHTTNSEIVRGLGHWPFLISESHTFAPDVMP